MEGASLSEKVSAAGWPPLFQRRSQQQAGPRGPGGPRTGTPPVLSGAPHGFDVEQP